MQALEMPTTVKTTLVYASSANSHIAPAPLAGTVLFRLGTIFCQVIIYGRFVYDV